MNESFYDEDLTENVFYQELKIEYKNLIDRATKEGWVICVPKVGSFEDSQLTDDDFLCHILVPNEETPQIYQTLSGKKAVVSDKLVTIEDDTSPILQTCILFEETFYTQDLAKYKVWCVECLLNQSDISSSSKNSSTSSVLTLKDCVDFLWTESLCKNILEQLDLVINDFLIKYTNLHTLNLQEQKDLAGDLYNQCVEIALNDTRLCENISRNKCVVNNVNISVEAYMQHNVYKELINSVSVYTAYDDSCFNKIVRNLCDIQLRDLQIKIDIYDAIPCAKHHLAKINSYNTVLGKINCLRNVVTEITLTTKNNITLSVDDLLPIFVFLILKTCIPNWITNLVFLKHFQFSSLSKGDETNFLITTLEAAIEYIRSGILLTSTENLNNQTDAIRENGDCHKNKLVYFYKQIRIGNYEEVKNILKKNISQNETETKSKELCHPLCSCDKCEELLTEIVCSTSPTVHSTDDKGYTALHIACMFGKPKIVELLLEYDADLQKCDYSGASPLHYAALRGHQNALLLLLHSGTNINAVDNEKNTPLHFASNNGHDACVKAILYFAEHQTNALNVNCANIVGDTPLHHAARWGYANIVHILLEYGADPNVENKLKKTPSDYCHNYKVYQMLLKAKCTFNLQENNSNNKKKIVKTTECDITDSKVDKRNKIERAFKPISPNEKKKAELLLRSVAYGDVPMLCYYLGLEIPENGEEISELCHPLCDCEKCTSTHDDYKINVNDKQNINVCNADGYTALHIASLHGQADIVKLLLENDALPNIPTKKGLTALHLACQAQRLEIVKLLLQSKYIDVNLQDNKGNSPLHHACSARDACIVEILIEHKANVQLKNCNGKTPFEVTEWKMFRMDQSPQDSK